MGTNYYCSNKFSKKKKNNNGLHIGKRSCGWTFNFRAHPDINLVSSKDWLNFLYTYPQYTIFDEYFTVISYNMFKDLVNQSLLDPYNQYLWCLKNSTHSTREETDWLDDYGFCFTSVDFC